MPKNFLDNGTVLTLGLVGAVAAIGVAAKRGVYGSRSTATSSVMERLMRQLNGHGSRFELEDDYLIVDDDANVSIVAVDSPLRPDAQGQYRPGVDEAVEPTMVEVAKRRLDLDGNLVSLKVLGQFSAHDAAGIVRAISSHHAGSMKGSRSRAGSSPKSHKTPAQLRREADGAMHQGEVEQCWYLHGRADRAEGLEMDRDQANDEQYGTDYRDGYHGRSSDSMPSGMNGSRSRASSSSGAALMRGMADERRKNPGFDAQVAAYNEEHASVKNPFEMEMEAATPTFMPAVQVATSQRKKPAMISDAIKRNARTRGSMSRDDFRTSHLRGDAKKLAEAIKTLVRDMNGSHPDGGGSTAFVSPAQRRRLGYDVSKNVVLVLGHDGGDLAPYLNPYYDHVEGYKAMRDLIRRMGYGIEMENSAITHLYKR